MDNTQNKQLYIVFVWELYSFYEVANCLGTYFSQGKASSNKNYNYRKNNRCFPLLYFFLYICLMWNWKKCVIMYDHELAQSLKESETGWKQTFVHVIVLWITCKWLKNSLSSTLTFKHSYINITIIEDFALHLL